jgi:hypothetical protein
LNGFLAESSTSGALQHDMKNWTEISFHSSILRSLSSGWPKYQQALVQKMPIKAGSLFDYGEYASDRLKLEYGCEQDFRN